MRRILVATSAILLVLSLFPVAGVAQDATAVSERPTPNVEPNDVLPPSLRDAEGAVEVVVVLEEEPLAVTRARGLERAAQVRQDRAVSAQQDRFSDRAAARGARELGTTRFALNAVALEVDASQLRALAADPDVRYLAPVPDFTYDIDETIELVGADAVHDLGVEGEGVTIAILDSGIDYTHVALGGRQGQRTYEGTALGPPGSAATPDDPGGRLSITQEWGEDWLQSYGFRGGPRGTRNPDYQSPQNRRPNPRLLPNEVVVGGYDFVGEVWPFGDLRPNPDPIDIGGHGTSVAGVIHGIAPAADLLGIKVCASFATSCSGVAILQGIDFALSPSGDPDMADRVDIMNFSLGALYGKSEQNPTVEAVENATELGVLTVASAGNSSDNPYISGTPSTSPSALGVAQTAVPRDGLDLIGAETIEEGNIVGPFPAVFQPWSEPPAEVYDNVLQYGDGAGGNLLGCEPFAAGSLDGLAVIVDRGVCNFTLKTKNILEAGGEFAIIVQNDGGPPFTGGDGGDRPVDIPTFMTFRDDGQALQAAAGTGATLMFDPDDAQPIVGSVVGSSSRGPSDANQLKPEIGAPGASIVATAGSFDGTSPFGGTSGAAPVVSGAAALMLGTDGDLRAPIEAAFDGDLVAEQVKARLINTAYRGIEHTVLEESMPGVPGGLAPITRIGGGEVRADAAYAARSIVWDADDRATGTLSLGFHEVDEELTITRTIEVVNYSDASITYDVTVEERYAAGANAAVTVATPASHTAAPGVSSFEVAVTVDPGALNIWNLDAGSSGDLGSFLTALEAGGYVVLNPTDGEDEVALPYQVLPRLSGDVSVGGDDLDDGTVVFGEDGTATLDLSNDGAGPAFVDAYELIATGEQGDGVPDFSGLIDVDIAAVGVQSFPGGCGGLGDLYIFAVAAHERVATVNFTSAFELQFDLNGDGEADSFLFNNTGADFGLLENNLVFAVGPDGGTAIRFFTTNGSNSTVTTMLACGGDLGFDTVDGEVAVDILGVDVYFTGLVTDVVSGTFSPHELAVTGGSVNVSPGGEAQLSLSATGADTAGLLLLPVAERFSGGISFYSGAETEVQVFDVDVTGVGGEEEPE
jgi:minor extracellular serine protease Vpr